PSTRSTAGTSRSPASLSDSTDFSRFCLAHENPFGTVQLPLNCLDGTCRSFEQQILPELRRRGIGTLGMKSLGGEGQPVLHGAVTAGRSAASENTLASNHRVGTARSNRMARSRPRRQ